MGKLRLVFNILCVPLAIFSLLAISSGYMPDISHLPPMDWFFRWIGRLLFVILVVVVNGMAWLKGDRKWLGD
jgi:hypothetical protein